MYLILFIAFASAVAAVAAVLVTKRVAQIQLFVSWLRDYSSKEMQEAVKKLYEWKEIKNKQPARFKNLLTKYKSLQKLTKSNDEDFEEIRTIDDARRRVSHYFTTAKDLCKNGISFKTMGFKINFKILKI